MVVAVSPGVTLTERASRNTARGQRFLSHQNKSTSSIRIRGTFFQRRT